MIGSGDAESDRNHCLLVSVVMVDALLTTTMIVMVEGMVSIAMIATPALSADLVLELEPPHVRDGGWS